MNGNGLPTDKTLYDKKTGRDSHFWRNMTQEEYEAELEHREEAQKSIPLEGEDIMR